MNPRKNDETWFPRKNFSHCVPNTAETCDNIPESEDLTFFLLNFEQIGGVDGYSDDDDVELQAMFTGRQLISYELFLNLIRCVFRLNFREHSDSKFIRGHR